VRHAGRASLDALEPLLAAVRTRGAATERSRGVFYRKGVAVLHFHEDPAGLFADLKTGGAWRRLRVSTAAERRAFLAAVRAAADWTPLASPSTGGRRSSRAARG
jgi:hypothetical protein